MFWTHFGLNFDHFDIVGFGPWIAFDAVLVGAIRLGGGFVPPISVGAGRGGDGRIGVGGWWGCY